MDQRYMPTSNPMRWVGNVFALLAFALSIGIAIDWLSGWNAYCWIRFQVGVLSHLYGVTIGGLALIFAAFGRFKLAGAIILPGFFPVVWVIIERELGFAPVCAAVGS